ncbi:hypothetical protein DTO271D3_6976 [Paecilomyces variotii]|nr:hypothetical protein DTO271D3_6976 [Paecilomyces variotii]KAJ9364389.1 hypothetical protein DTO280E4_1635 [Paecilomyces variotii]
MKSVFFTDTVRSVEECLRRNTVKSGTDTPKPCTVRTRKLGKYASLLIGTIVILIPKPVALPPKGEPDSEQSLNLRLSDSNFVQYLFKSQAFMSIRDAGHAFPEYASIDSSLHGIKHCNATLIGHPPTAYCEGALLLSR